MIKNFSIIVLFILICLGSFSFVYAVDETDFSCLPCGNRCAKILPNMGMPVCEDRTENFNCESVNGNCVKITATGAVGSPVSNCPDVLLIECVGGQYVSDGTDATGCPNTPKCVKKLSNGKETEIKIMPEAASEKAVETLGNLGFNIQLKEVGGDSSAKFVYQTDEKEKEVRILGIFKTKMKVSAEIDALTGEVKIKMPWWGIFAW